MKPLYVNTPFINRVNPEKERIFHTMASSKKILIAAMLILCFALGTALLPIHGEEAIYDTVVRLHVVANSDSPEDQELKLKVRDAVIDITSPALQDCKTQTEAISAIESIIPQIEAAARSTVIENGYSYSVSVDLGKEYYPTKTYESCAFPSGEYVSLRVLLGESDGQNWWCCLFPPLCLSTATPDDKQSNEDAFISVGLTSDQYKLITETNNPKYKVRFKIIETISSWFK